MDLKLTCNCGKVKGLVHNVRPGIGNRIVCYCKDCQAFASALDRDSDTLDAYGGTDIYQSAPARVEITHGQEFVSCLKLSVKGLHRWFTSCCNTPIGNTGNPAMPLVGLIHTFISRDQAVDTIIGKATGPVFAKQARASLPDELKGPKSQFVVVLIMMAKLLSWKLTGKGLPNPFFSENGKPIAEPRVLETQSES